MCTYGRRCLLKRAEPYLQHDTTSKWDVLTLVRGDVPNFRSSEIDTGRQDGGAALEEVVVVFDTFSRRRLQLKNVDGGTSIWETGASCNKNNIFQDWGSVS